MTANTILVTGAFGQIRCCVRPSICNVGPRDAGRMRTRGSWSCRNTAPPPWPARTSGTVHPSFTLGLGVVQVIAARKALSSNAFPIIPAA
jgi:hypothetical protein